MKVLYIITMADRGGAQKYVLDLARHFKGSIAAGIEAGELFEQAKQHGVTIYPVQSLKRGLSPVHDLRCLFELINLINRVNPDIVHANSSKAGILGSISGWLCGKKIVFTAHGFFYLYNISWIKKHLYILIERLVTLVRNVIITVSRQDAEAALASGIAAPNKIRVVHNGIGPINFLARGQAKRDLNLPDEKIIIGTVAQLYQRKGYDVLIEALATTNRRLPTFFAAAIGSGPELSRLQAQIEKQGLTNSMKLCGSREEAARYLKAFDIFVLPSRREGFPYVLLEALQAGLPIIATDVGGNREVLGDSGILVPAEDPLRLERALAQLIENADLRGQLGQQALRRAANFSITKMLEQTAIVYASLR